MLQPSTANCKRHQLITMQVLVRCNTECEADQNSRSACNISRSQGGRSASSALNNGTNIRKSLSTLLAAAGYNMPAAVATAGKQLQVAVVGTACDAAAVATWIHPLTRIHPLTLSPCGFTFSPGFTFSSCHLRRRQPRRLRTRARRLKW